MKKIGFVVFVLLSGVLSAFAHGKRDVEERDVSQMDSWQEEFDISKRKEGKYNAMVIVQDKGGNETVGGPYNIFIDPDSDYTISSITNPINNMRVPGNLNIVGTCIDDDGVDEVWLILDGGEPIKANGREFWSYYLDTTKLAEGPHTIEVYGIDINGLSSENKPAKKHKVTWNLDRRLPVTQVTNMELGTLVSGKITLKGTVSDGNGIKRLEYSLDGRKTFHEIKLSEDKKSGICNFELPVNTKETADGAAVCWFKSTDKMGSVGYDSFLYFIDNTKPDVKIVSPAVNEVVNGRFGVAGFAKDKIGIQKLTWTCGEESGEFELTPGNPFWYKEIDTIGMNVKKIDFSVTALDTAGNSVTVKRSIPLDQESDKPVVTIESPANGGTVESLADAVFLRGIATDDDGVASIEYKLDDKETQTIETHGVFYAPLSAGQGLSGGVHKVTVTAIDKYGVRGNPVTTTFTAMGAAPAYSGGKINSSIGTFDAFTGVSVHPESEPKYETTLTSDCGLSLITWQLNWGTNGSKTGEVALNAKGKTSLTSVPVSIPLSGNDIACGSVYLTITATDIYNRTTIKKELFKVLDLTQINVDSPRVVFDDSRVSENGDIINDTEHPVSGYFVGGKIKNASLVPSTPFATLEFNEHTITLNATESLGTSAEVKVRVTSEDNIVYESSPLVFHSDSPAPVVSLEQTEINVEQALAEDGTEIAPDKIKISGEAVSKTPLNSLKYRIITVPAVFDIKTPALVAGAGSVDFGEYVDFGAKTGRFDFELDPSTLKNGISVVEVVADNGKLTSSAAIIRKLPELPLTTSDGKKVPAPKTFYTWIDGVDVYCVITQQNLKEGFSRTFLREEMAAGSPELSVKDSTGKILSKYTTKKEGNTKVFIESVAGEPYASGMNVVLARGNSGKTLTAQIVSEFALTGVNWTIFGEKTPGGDEKQSGKVELKSIKQIDSTHYQAEIPLTNLPSRLTTVNITAETANSSASYKGTIAVIRERDSELIDNSKRIYWAPDALVTYDIVNERYVLKTGEKLGSFANVMGPVSASLVTAQSGLTVTADGNFVYVVADKEGIYKNVSVKVIDSQGISYTSNAVDILVDDSAPLVEITEPTVQKWVKKILELSVKASDTNGISSVEYSLDNGQSWSTLKSTGNGLYTTTANIETFSDGLLPVDVRVTDIAGRESFAQTVVHIDTIAPEVQVVVPGEGDIVNGENLIAFIVKDNGYFERAEYIPPKTGNVNPAPVEVPVGSMVVTHIGTADKPINDLMVFNFYDENGNVETVRRWDFIIDQKSDLPIAEVHVPEEGAVITTDFNISGIVVDDDGPSKVYYKIDNGEYTLFTGDQEYSTSFKERIELSRMTDNEHSVTVYAEDLNGVKGPEFTRNFKISLEEPKGAVLTPKIDTTIRGWAKITGKATDKNGISKVLVSVDNGNSYNEAVGNFSHEKEECDWSYEFDSRIIEDGTHVVFFKVVDWFGIEGLYSSLINIDNTAPKINLELPLDDSRTTKMLFFSGQTTDNIGLKNLYITIRSLEGKTVNPKLAKINLTPGEIITESIDLSSLDNGFYNVELTGTDAADNITRVSRNVQLNKAAAMAKVDLLYPLNGENVRGVFNIYGTAISEIRIESLDLLIDGNNVARTTMSESGYFKFKLEPELITDGTHKVQVRANLANVSVIMSNEQTLNYSAVGPWVTIDNFTYGDFAINRPYIEGDAGYSISADELIAAKAKGASKELKDVVFAKTVEKVELSFNNGKSFQTVSKSGKWHYRIENEDIEEGYHFILVRATMKNGEIAVTRTIVQVDKTKPSVRLISPGEGGHFNQSIEFSGLAHDDVALKSVSLALRKGDKSSYEVPSFIQGLYFDWHFWGATLFDLGVGLSFFDDTVRLQAQWGQFTQAQRNMFSKTDMRYGGDSVFGAKILANVAHIPFMYFFGRDFEWLSANVTVGANFTRFNQGQSGKAQVLSAVLAQLEFPRVTFAKQKMFRTFSVYTEGQLWFIPTDVSSDTIENLVPQISVGLRMNVF